MTADIKLLPLPEPLRRLPGWSAIESYARSNVAHATAAKDAEIHRLRAEVDRLRGEHVRVRRDRNAKAARAEQLAEALRGCVDLIETFWPIEGPTTRKALAALRDHDQEDEK